MNKSVWKYLSVPLLVLGMILARGAAMADQFGYLPLSGGNMKSNSTVTLGDFPSALSNITIPMTAGIAITKGQPVIYASVTYTGYPNLVTLTASAGDQKVLGIATNTAAFGATVNIAVQGVVMAKFGASPTAGVLYMTGSGAAGDLTPTTTAAGTAMTPVSRNPSILVTLETKVTGSDGLARALIVR